MAESSLHLAIKKWIQLPDDLIEERIGNYIIDLVRGTELIEIQTRQFKALHSKLQKLTRDYPVRLVHPIAQIRWLVYLSEDNQPITRRKSPKKGSIYDLFDHLLYISDCFNSSNLILDILFTEEEELRCDDGKGSWRRKGVSILDRRLIQVIHRQTFYSPKDFLLLIPSDLPKPFSNKTLAKNIHKSVSKARKITYTMRKMGLIHITGKQRNELLFDTIPPVSHDSTGNGQK